MWEVCWASEHGASGKVLVLKLLNRDWQSQRPVLQPGRRSHQGAGMIVSNHTPRRRLIHSHANKLDLK
jgi:hypothetical protein